MTPARYWLGGIAATICILMGAFAKAHDAPAGWRYDLWCCSEADCGMLHTEVKPTPSGWLITETGETFPYDDSHVLQSKDDAFHRCENRQKPQLSNGKFPTRCLYAPPQGS